MLKIEELEEFRNIRDKFQSSYTILINNIQVDDIISRLYKKLDIINTIKDGVRKKYLNDRVYTLIEHFKQLDPETFNSGIYLLGKDIHVIDLKKDWINVLNDWSVPNFIFMNGEYFDIDYLTNLLLDISYLDIIRIMNKKLTHTQINTTKRREITEMDMGGDFELEEYISKNTKGKCMVHGVSSTTKSFKPTDGTLVFPRSLTDEQIFKEFDKADMLETHEIVEELFGHMKNEKMMHRVLIGKDINKAIKYSQIQTLYCSPKMAAAVMSKVPDDLKNFKIVEVLTLEAGDTGDVLNKDYKGAIGWTYF